MRTIKSKIALGIGTLFGLLLAISIVAFICINMLSSRTESLLAANYQSVSYCYRMLQAMDESQPNAERMAQFEMSLRGQEANVTEPGEAGATRELRALFDRWQSGNTNPGLRDSINHSLYLISEMNQKALALKNEQALKTSADAKLGIALLAALAVLIGFTLSVNLPGYIANPVRLLTDAILEVAEQNYSKRIHLDNRDEFGRMAAAFNTMASRLDEYQNSSMDKLLFEKKRVETVINQLEDAVLGMDAEGKILFINKAAEHLYHLRSDDIVGKTADEIARLNDLLRTLLAGVSTTPLRIISEGKEHFYAATTREVSNEGSLVGIVYTLSDITSFKELDISKTNFLATVSHELKTPIASIKMSARLMNDPRVGALNPEQQDLMQSIHADAERLLRLTAELLNITQLETGNIQMNMVKAAATVIADHAIAAVQMVIQEKAIQLQTEYSPQDLLFVMADPDKTEWVLINFLTNAIKFSEPGAAIRVSVMKEAGAVVFSVRDEGSGIAAADQQRIFDRYYRLQGQVPGTGVGLSICKEFIEAQGGVISLSSAPGKGSTFRFALPEVTG